MTKLPLAWAIHAMLHHCLNTTTLSSLSPLSPSFSLRPHLRHAILSRKPPASPTQPGYPPWEALEPAVVLNPQEPVYSNSGSHDTVPASDAVVDERVRRRRLSNRESARRSRMRKQKHLENLRNELNRLRLMNRVMLAVHQDQVVRGENEWLCSEATILRRRLCDITDTIRFTAYTYGSR
ncbi:hypothetical protein SASPL_151975 [Salvia splendens]|uniref:BZIP domain-containing protein n=1 Tax=Salvia splendens TaxID=180675 RepID=A0A8X8YZW8_SALSN|nr:hypothetical protein SASPL_151975 [Salvia splendens]